MTGSERIRALAEDVDQMIDSSFARGDTEETVELLFLASRLERTCPRRGKQERSKLQLDYAIDLALVLGVIAALLLPILALAS